MRRKHKLNAAFAILVATVGVSDAQPVAAPSEVPPATYAASQYVDSRGCVFTRAAIDGSVIWVARVTPDRRQVCGRTPSLEQPLAQANAAPSDPLPTSTPGSETLPAAAPKADAGQHTGSQDILTSNTRIVPRHVYDKRQNTRIGYVPYGFRSVWKDDRLNPHRAEMTLRASQVHPLGNPPRGYRVAWDDERLNQNRGQRSAYGDSQMGRIWTNTVPRTLIPVPTQVPVVAIERPKQQRNTPFWQPEIPDQTNVGAATVTRLSTRSRDDFFQPRADR